MWRAMTLRPDSARRLLNGWREKSAPSLSKTKLDKVRETKPKEIWMTRMEIKQRGKAKENGSE